VRARSVAHGQLKRRKGVTQRAQAVHGHHHGPRQQRALQAALVKSRKVAAKQDRALRKQRKVLDALASQPDTSQSPMRMAALTKNTASAAPAGPQTATA
jgi:hypothetical protein